MKKGLGSSKIRRDFNSFSGKGTVGPTFTALAIVSFAVRPKNERYRDNKYKYRYIRTQGKKLYF